MPRKGYQAITLKNEIVEALDRLPGEGRSQKIAQMIKDIEELQQANNQNAAQIATAYKGVIRELPTKQIVEIIKEEIKVVAERLEE